MTLNNEFTIDLILKKKPYLKTLIINLVAFTCLLGFTQISYGQSAQKHQSPSPNWPEVRSLRSATAKHFENDNGGLTAVIGNWPIHYEEAPGVWKDIDLTTVKSPTSGFIRENTTNSIRSFYPLLGDNSHGVQISTSKGSIAVGGELKMLHYDSDGIPVLMENAGRKAPTAASNQVLYSNLFTNADLEYLIGAGQIKSNLILKSLPTSLKGGLGYFGFSETVELPSGWTLKTVEGTVSSTTSTRFPIQVVDNVGDIAFVIPVPDVYEKNSPSTSIHPDGNWPIAYKINKHGSVYELITMVPLDWMTATDRVYPLVIDPTVVEPGNYGGWQDNAGFFESNPSGFVFAGFYTGTDHRAYAKFSTASIPDNAQIDDIQLELYQNGSEDANPQTILINDITGAPGPYGAANTAAYTDFGNGLYTTITTTVNGTYGPFDLGASADTNLQNRLGLDWFQIALYNAGTFKRFTSDSSKIIVAYDTCIVASYTTVNVLCATDSNGSATVSIDSLIAPPYTFSWNTTPVQTSATATGLTVGTYQLTTTDSSGCTTSKFIDIEQLFTSVISSSTDISCNGDSTGSATVVASGGGLPYTYQWDDPSNQTTATANNLPAGIYEVLITDATGCIDSSEVEIFEPAALTLISSTVDNSCATASNGSATVTVAGGTPGYAYLWNDPSFQTTPTATGLPAGLYNIVVTDTMGCMDSILSVVGNPPPNDVGVISIDAPVSGCGLTSAELVTITLVNFGANLQTAIPVMYQVNGGPIVTEMVTGNILSCDTVSYTFTATTNMSVLGSYSIDSWTGLIIDGDQLNDSMRFVLVINNPVISALPYNEDFEGETACSEVCGTACVLSGPWTNNTANDDIDWAVDGGGTSSLSTGPAVDHTLGSNTGKYIYTEASGCLSSKALIISPCIDLSSAANPYLDFWYHMYGATMGKLAVDIYSGGVWTIGVDSLIGDQGNAWRYRDIDLGSFSGIIRIRFRGVTGSSFTSDMALDDIRVYDKPPEDVGAIGIDSPFSGCALDTNEVVTIQVQNFGVNTQDTLFLFYQIDGGPIVSETLVGTFLPGDTIQYTFQDSADLSVIGAYNFDVWANVTGDGDSSNDSTLGYSVTNLLNVSAFPYNENFESGQNGWISGGTNSSWAFGLPQKFVIDTAASGVNAWVTGGLGLGVYNNNENSYVLSPCFDFSSLTSPVIKMSVWWNSEFSQDGASLQSSIDNGLTWQDVGQFGDANNWFTDNSIIALAPSGSQVGWTGRNLTADGSVDWVQASKSLVSLAGEATVVFRVNFGSDGAITDDGFGFDDVEISDALHCLNGILDADETGIDCGGVDCTPCYCLSTYTDTTDEWISDVSFNTISNPSGSSSYSDFTNLSTTIVKGNTYPIWVEPSVGGPWTEYIWAWIDWNQNNDFSDPGEAYFIDTASGTCLPCAPITANITVPAGAAMGATRMRVTLEFNVDPFPCGGGTFGETEDYTVIITDNCATLSGTGSDVLCFNGASGLASVSTTGGNGPFTFLWDDSSAQTDSIASGLTAGSYQVIVSDSLGCMDSTSVTIGEPTPLTISLVDSGNISCLGLSDGFAVVEAAGGTTPYAYNWVGPGTLNDSVMGLPTGTYTNEVTDSNGCMTDLSVFLSEPPLLTVSTTKTDETCTGNCDGAIEAVASGGTPGYSFIWNTASNLNAEFDLCPATYWVKVDDFNGCTTQDTIVILGATGPIVADAGPDLSVCLGDSIQIGGSPTSSDTSATILWSPGDSISSISVSNPMIYPSTNTTYSVEIFAGGISFILTDMFDYGEDQVSHIYSDSGDVLLGGNTCNVGMDSTMQIGACAGIAGSWAEFTASVKTGTDSLQLAFVVPLTGTGGASIYVDGLLQGTIEAPITSVCDPVLMTIGSMAPLTTDGQVVIRIQDNTNGCDGDGQIESVKVYSKNMCSSIDLAEILIDPVFATSASDSICAGDSIFLGGAYQFGAGSYVDNLSSVLGCDSMVTTTLSIISIIASNDTVAICIGDSVFLEGRYQTIAGPYIDMYPASNGCDSTVTTELVIISITTNLQDTICDGDSILLAGAFQYSAGSYVDSLIASGGCDSLVITALTVNAVSTTLNTITICDNDSAFIEGSYQSTPGVYIDTFATQLGCDSIVNTTLVVNTTYTTPGIATICANDSIFLGGGYQNSAGLYTDTLSSVDGCDSIVQTNLSIDPVFAFPASAVICNGDSILIGGTYRTTAGSYDDSLSSINGCDSVISITLTVNPTYSNNLAASMCDGDSLLIVGSWRLTAGSYSDSLLSLDGCDSVTTTILTVNPIFTMTDIVNICDNDSAFLQGSFQTTTGIYVDTFPSQFGCDSIVTTNLEVNPTYFTSSSSTICANDSIFLGGAYQNTAGFYTDTLSSVDGCDSVVQTFLTVNPVFSVPASAVLCNGDSILIGGVYRTTTGTYDDSLSTVNGCDSIISTALTVNPTYLNNPTVSICNGDSALIAGIWYTTAGSYADSLLSIDGCDSVTTTLLTVNPTYTTNDTAAICFGDSILLGGSYQTTSGSYVDTYTTSSGCDSTVTTFLGIGTPILLTVSSFDALCDSSCDGTAQLTTTGGVGNLAFSWNTSPVQTSDTAFGLCAGTYIVTVTDDIGCQVQDSASVASPPPLAPVIVSVKNPTCSGLCDGSITTFTSGGTPPTTYLWNDPSAQTNSNALNLCAGSYTLSVTDSNGCAAILSAILTDPTPLVVTVTGTDSICTGSCTGTAFASVTGGIAPITYTWSSGPNSSTLSALCTGTYSVIVEDSLACQSDDSITISNFPIESASFSYPLASYCQNGNAPMPIITGDGGGTFSAGPNLSINTSTGQLLPDSSLPGTYNVLYTTGGPCPDTDTVQVEILAVPAVNIISISPICGSDSTDLSLIAVPSGGTWGGAGIIDSINGVFSPTTVGAGLHLVTYTYSNGSCSNTDSTIIKILPLPSISISGSDTICEGGTAVFQVSILGLGPFDITYSDGTNTFSLSNLYNGDTMSFSPTVTTTYTLLSLSDSAGCSGAVGGSRTIYVIAAPPQPIVTSPVYHCEGDPIPPLTALPQVGGNMNWYNDTLLNPVGTGNTYTPFGLNPGSNLFYVSEFMTGCSSYASEIEVISFTQGSIDAGNDVKTCLGTAVTLQATGGSSYIWYPSKGLSDTTISNPDANPDATTMYYVIATVNDSCQYVDSVRVTVDNSADCGWYIYNGFTPNSDGDNDEWIIDGIEGFPDNEVTIYNRWEDVVQAFTGYNNTSVVWKGDNKSGQALPEGTYFYIIIAGDDKYSGWVQLTR